MNYGVHNNTDFNYSYCNEYLVKLGEQSKVYHTLTLKISFIADVYTMHVTEYLKNKKVGRVIENFDLNSAELLIEKLHIFLREKDFYEISRLQLDIPVESVSLELAEQPTLGKCLFDDF